MLSSNDYRLFTELACKIGKSKSEIMRELIVRYLKEQRQQVGEG